MRDVFFGDTNVSREVVSYFKINNNALVRNVPNSASFCMCLCMRELGCELIELSRQVERIKVEIANMYAEKKKSPCT